MKITPVNNRYQYSQPKPVFKGVVEDLGVVVKDVFAKTKIDEKDKETLFGLLAKSCNELIKPERFLGSGFWGEVYAIDNTLAAKINKSAKDAKNFLFGDLKLGKNIFKDLKTYYGESLGKIGQFEILKNVGNHTPAGVPSKEVKKMNSIEECEEYYRNKYLPQFAKVPQESYDNLIGDIAKLNKMKFSKDEYYVFDSKNPGNIVLAGDKLFLIDGMNTVNHPDYNTVGKLLEVMLYKLTTHRTIIEYGNSVKEGREILKKIILASEKANLPYDTRISDENIWKQVLYNCNIKMEANDFIQNLERIRGKNPNVKKRLPKVEKFLNGVFENDGKKNAHSSKFLQLFKQH